LKDPSRQLSQSIGSGNRHLAALASGLRRRLGSFPVRIEMASSIEVEHVRKVWDNMKANPDFAPIYSFLLQDADIVSATKGIATARLTLSKNHVNSRGTIHGAVSATIVDWASGLAISSHGLEKTGASVDIHVTYIGTAQVGETIEIEATADKVGRNMAFTSIRIYKLVDGKPGPMIATASHTKFIVTR
jgi:acyl-coenzyme A thioesterase 13